MLDNKAVWHESNNTDEDLDEAFVSAEYGGMNEDDEKTAVSRAMEQLLVDMEHRSESLSDSVENLKASSDDEGDDDVFQEYRKHLSSRSSVGSQSDIEQSSSFSRDKSRNASSKSATDGKLSGSADKVQEPERAFKSSSMPSLTSKTEGLDATEKSVLRSIQQMSDNSNSTSGSGETTLQVLRSVSEIKEPEDQDIDHCIQYLDDRFVTKRSRSSAHKSEGLSDSDLKRNGSLENFTISTPSNSSKRSSVGSLTEDIDLNLNKDDNNAGHESEDERPDSDLLRDYQMTLSQALGEDEELPPHGDIHGEEDLDQTLNAEDIEMTSPRSEDFVSPRSEFSDTNDKGEFISPRSDRNSSVYETPESSLNDQSAAELKAAAENVIETVENDFAGARKKSDVPNTVSAKDAKTDSGRTFLGFDIKRKKSGSIKPPKVIKSDIVNTPMMPVKSGTIIRPLSHRSREGSVESNPLEKDAWGDSSSCSSLNSVKSSDASQKTWRPLPPVPIESQESPKQSKTVTKSGTGRKLPDPKQVQTKSPGVFQSKFMQKAYSSNTDSGDSSTKSPSPTEFQKPVITSQPRPLPSKPVGNKPSEQTKTKNQTKDLKSSGGKTKISVDYSKLTLDKDSGSESEKKKKRIPVATALKKSVKPTLSGNSTTSVENQSDNDIPFADDSEDDVLDEKFFTPATSIKPKRPAIRREGAGCEAKKRLLPTPPKFEPSVLSADKIRNIRKAEIEKARKEARERARLKSDEELGVRDTPYSKYKRTVSNESSQSNYASATVSESEELSSPVDRPTTVTFTPDVPQMSAETPKHSKGKKKKKSKSREGSLSSVENLDMEVKKDKKKKSLLASILSGVKTPQKDLKDKDRSSSNDTLEEKASKKKKGKTQKSEKKEKKKRKTLSVDDSLTDNMKELKIGDVFMSKPGRRPGLKGRILPPKASGENKPTSLLNA